MKKQVATIYLFAMSLLSTLNAQEYNLIWEHIVDSVSSFASPRSMDMNNDGVEDIIMGTGNEYDSLNYVVCINGIDGSLLWKTKVESDIFGSCQFLDLDNDSRPEVFIGGRVNGFFCLNGANGEIIWEYNLTERPIELVDKKYNFYNPQIIPDQDSDGIKDILVSYGGDANLPANSNLRKTGYLMILKSTNGKILALDSMPDSKETYYSPMLLNFTGSDSTEIIFGTGGETDGGSLWLSNIASLKNKSLHKDAIRLDGPFNKGFVQPCLVTDFNEDGSLDVLSISIDGRINLIDGLSRTKKWEIYLPEYEMYSAPVPVISINKTTPDVALIISRGVFENTYQGFQTLLINSDDGTYKVVNEDGYIYQINSGVSYYKDEVSHLITSYNGFDSLNDRYTVQFFDINLNNNSKKNITDTIEGNNFGSTPILKDLDKDGHVELIIAHNIQDFRTIPKVRLMNIKTNLLPEEVTWNGYMGPKFNNTYNVSPTTSSKIELELSSKIYPNPTNGYVKIECTSSISEIILSNSEGKILLRKSNINSSDFLIDISNTTSGIYQLHLISGAKSTTHKLIKQ